MDSSIVVAILTGLAGLIGLFFGKQYWSMFSGLVKDQKAEVARLQMIVRELRTRIDEVERLYYEKVTELETAMNQLDNQVTDAQFLTLENQRLKAKNAELQAQIDSLTDIYIQPAS